MSFWENQMPAGMCLRSNWGLRTSRIPSEHLHSTNSYAKRAITYRSLFHSIASLITGWWYQSQAVPDLEKRQVRSIDANARGFKVVDGGR